MSLQLVKNGMTDTVIFGPYGKIFWRLSSFFKKKIFFLIWGSFRPVTKVHEDMLKRGYELSLKESHKNPGDIAVICEITLSNLTSAGELDERDFLDRVDILRNLNHMVMI